MSQELITHKPWKPVESQLNTFETVYTMSGAVVYQTKPLLGQEGFSALTDECVRTTDLIILKMMEIW